MNDKKKLVLIIIAILGIILIGVGIGYTIYKIQDNSYQKLEDNYEEDINDLVDDVVDELEDNVIDDENIGKKIDINTIDMNKKLYGEKFIPIELNEIYAKNEEVEQNEGYSIKYKYNDNVFYLTDKNGNKKEYFNVKKIYKENFECASETKYFVLENNRLNIISVSSYSSSLDDLEEEIIYTNKSYDAIYSIYVSINTCDAIYEYVGYTDDGKFYDLNTGDELDTSIEYSIFKQVTVDRKLKIDNYNLKVKLLMTGSYSNGVLDYIINDKNHLYGFTWNGEKTVFSKLSDKKVKYVYYDDSNEYTYVQFEDLSFYNFNEYSNYYSYSYIEY